MDELIPDLGRKRAARFQTHADRGQTFLVLRQGGLDHPAAGLPAAARAAQSRHVYRLARRCDCRWLATTGRGAGRRRQLIPGLCGASDLTWREDGLGQGRRSPACHGHREERRARPRLYAGHRAATGKYVLIARGRARLAGQAADPRTSSSTPTARPQSSASASRSCGGSPPEKHPAGTCAAHVRLAARAIRHGRRLVPLPFRRSSFVAVGLRRPPRLQEPVAVALRGVPALQDPSAVIAPVEGGKRVRYGARAITEGGCQSVPRSSPSRAAR